MEKERKINWLGLFIKIIIIFIFILIIIWLISKITLKTKVSDAFKNNINNMETVATNYFKEVDLPEEKGNNRKLRNHHQKRGKRGCPADRGDPRGRLAKGLSRNHGRCFSGFHERIPAMRNRRKKI